LILVVASCGKKDVKTDGDATSISGAEASAPPPPPPPADEVNDLKKIYFDLDKSNIRANMRADLKFDVAWLKKNKSATVQIEGNCDERGSDSYNQALGMRRAVAVKKYFEHHGIRGKRLTAISNGKSKPEDPGHDEGAWQQNRRVAFRILAQ
jgi:peptidoglycan-associated lipoprotein